MILIGLTGYARSGKDTVGARLIDEHGFVRVAFADAVRDATLALDPIVDGYQRRVSDIVIKEGWEFAKTQHQEIRELLQRMGTEVGRQIFGEQVWVNIVHQKVEDILRTGQNKIVITDVRFANEATFLERNGGQVWRVDREGTGPANAHASENLDFEVDQVIHNDSDLPALYSKVDSLLRSIE